MFQWIISPNLLVLLLSADIFLSVRCMELWRLIMGTFFSWWKSVFQPSKCRVWLMNTITFKGSYASWLLVTLKLLISNRELCFHLHFNWHYKTPMWRNRKEKLINSFLQVQSSKLKVQTVQRNRQMKCFVEFFFKYGFIWKVKIGMKVFNNDFF